MMRREFIALIGGAAAAWPLAARAQPPAKTVRLGVLATLPLPPVKRLFPKLQEHGYVEGRNLRLEARFAEGQDDRYPALAAELVALPLDIIVTWGTPAALAAEQASTTIPIVMGAIADPVSVGIVSNLARPEGNVTGFSSQNVDLEVKRLELSKTCFLSSPASASSAMPPIRFSTSRWRSCAPRRSGWASASSSSRSTTAMRPRAPWLRLDRARPDAVLVPADLLLLTKRSEIAAALARSKLPAVYAIREFAVAGAHHHPSRRISVCCSSARRAMSTAFSKVPSPPTCPSSWRPNSS